VAPWWLQSRREASLAKDWLLDFILRLTGQRFVRVSESRFSVVVLKQRHGSRTCSIDYYYKRSDEIARMHEFNREWKCLGSRPPAQFMSTWRFITLTVSRQAPRSSEAHCKNFGVHNCWAVAWGHGYTRNLNLIYLLQVGLNSSTLPS
jgi:hypothetical protein